MDQERTRALERKIVTVLFADLVGFTSLSEGLDPEDVSAVQDAYFAAVRETVGRYGGRLEKFIGDAAMAVFGVPLARDDDAERAVRAGLALTSAIEQVGAGCGLEEGALRLRVGVNTGEVAVHPEAAAEEGMVTGDAVNVAARFQASAPPGGVVVGETTALAVADAIELEQLGPLDLKGKAARVPAWRAAGVLPERSRDRAMGSLRAPILGREDELAALERALDRAQAGRAERWLVVAAPGVGKTRLVEEVARRAESNGVRALRARLRPDVIGPFQAVSQLVAAALRAAGLDLGGSPSVAERQAVAREFLVGLLAAAGASAARAEVVAGEAVAVTWPDEASAEPAGGAAPADREARFAAWLEALQALTGASAAIWVVEDLHWGGGDLLAFLDHALAAPGHRLILATTRPSLLERAEEWCRERPDRGHVLLHLPQLSPPHASDLVRALVGDALEAGLVDRIVERSDGNPLFIEELLRTWVSVGVLADEDGTWRMTAVPEAVHLPATVQSIYAAQIDDLPSGARLAARRASVAGRRFPSAALEPLEVPDAEEAIGVLSRRALVSGPDPDPFAGPTFSFRHALLRDAGYASLARAERARLHVRLARWIEEVAGDRAAAVAEVVGGHYAAALESAPALAREVGEGLGREDTARLAAHWFERAGDAALAIAAHEAARTLLRRSLDLTSAADVLDRARRWERLGEATAFSADMDEGAAAFQQAIEEYRTAFGDERRPPAERSVARAGLARATTLLGRVWNQQLGFDRSAALADDLLQELGEGEDAETARLLILRAQSVVFGHDQVVPARADSERALAIARSAGDRAVELDTLEWLAALGAEEGVASIEEWRAVEELAGAEGRWSSVAGAIRMQAQSLLDDRAWEVWPVVDRMFEIAEARGLTESRAWGHYNRAEAGFVSGQWERAVEEGILGIELGDRYAYHRATVRTWFVVVAIASARGDAALVERGLRWWEGRRDEFPSVPSPYALVMLAAFDLHFAAVGLIPPSVPELEPRLASFELDPANPSWMAGIETVVASWITAGEIDGTRRALDAMARRLEELPNPSSLARGTERLLRARLLRAEGAPAESVAVPAQTALRAFRTSRAPWWIAKCIRELESAGHASPEEVDEAGRIERALGVVVRRP